MLSNFRDSSHFLLFLDSRIVKDSPIFDDIDSAYKFPFENSDLYKKTYLFATMDICSTMAAWKWLIAWRTGTF